MFYEIGNGEYFNAAIIRFSGSRKELEKFVIDNVIDQMFDGKKPASAWTIKPLKESGENEVILYARGVGPALKAGPVTCDPQFESLSRGAVFENVDARVKHTEKLSCYPGDPEPFQQLPRGVMPHEQEHADPAERQIDDSLCAMYPDKIESVSKENPHAELYSACRESVAHEQDNPDPKYPGLLAAFGKLYKRVSALEQRQDEFDLMHGACGSEGRA